MDDGALVGSVDVRNVSQETVRVSNKPRVRPLDGNGSDLGVRTIITLELRSPSFAVLEPGGRARAAVRWPAWGGKPPGDRVVVEWPGGEQQVNVSGPTAPAFSEGADTLGTSWFESIPEDAS